MIYKLAQGERVEVNGITIENKNVLSGISQNRDRKMTTVTLLVTLQDGESKEFTAEINQWASTAERHDEDPKTGIITAYGNEIQITKADGFAGPDIEFTIKKL